MLLVFITSFCVASSSTSSSNKNSFDAEINHAATPPQQVDTITYGNGMYVAKV